MAQFKSLFGEPLSDPLFAFDIAISGNFGTPSDSEFSVATFPGQKVDFRGSFTVSAGAITAGTVTGFDILFGTTKLAVAKGLSVDAADLWNALHSDQDAVYRLLFQDAALDFKGSTLNDAWEGSPFADKIDGKDGSDRLYGGDGNDTMQGGEGADLLLGLGGFDKISGGDGKDTFGFEIHPSGPVGFDKLKDFKVGEDMISFADFTLHLDAGILAKAQFHKGGEATDPDQVVIYDKKSGSIFIDLDGSGEGDQYLLAKVKAGTKLDAGDFFVEPVFLP